MILAEITEVQLHDLMESAAEKGATRALAAVGLGDQFAARDITEIRNWYGYWKRFTQAATEAAAKVIMVAVLGALATGFAVKLKVFG